jgi:hypothetical protein
MRYEDIERAALLKENSERIEKVIPELLEMKGKTVCITICRESVLLVSEKLTDFLYSEWKNEVDALKYIGVDISSKRILPEGGES